MRLRSSSTLWLYSNIARIASCRSSGCTRRLVTVSHRAMISSLSSRPSRLRQPSISKLLSPDMSPPGQRAEDDANNVALSARGPAAALATDTGSAFPVANAEGLGYSRPLSGSDSCRGQQGNAELPICGSGMSRAEFRRSLLKRSREHPLCSRHLVRNESFWTPSPERVPPCSACAGVGACGRRRREPPSSHQAARRAASGAPAHARQPASP